MESIIGSCYNWLLLAITSNFFSWHIKYNLLPWTHGILGENNYKKQRIPILMPLNLHSSLVLAMTPGGYKL